MNRVKIIGAGLAGSEAASQLARRGVQVELYEMRPVRTTPAHQTSEFAELVCSNSLKSESENTAPWLLKEEMRRVGSLLLEIARECAVPAGHALAVDRAQFSTKVTEAISREPLVQVFREEVTAIKEDEIRIIATGPLTSDALAEEIARLSAGPSRAGAPAPHLYYYESCLPIEEIARRGRDTLRFGPMKPVGLRDPRTGNQPYAVVQLRQENLRADSYNLVGFQNHLKFGEQARVLRLIPGLENARFLRYGQIHRNTYINSPALLTPTLQMKAHPAVLFAGQICGVEGYVESIATGMLAGIHAAAIASGETPVAPPRATALGSLMHYINNADAKKFQPANITFDLLPPLETRIRDRQLRRRMQCESGLCGLEKWLQGLAEVRSQNAEVGQAS